MSGEHRRWGVKVTSHAPDTLAFRQNNVHKGTGHAWGGTRCEGWNTGRACFCVDLVQEGVGVVPEPKKSHRACCDNEPVDEGHEERHVHHEQKRAVTVLAHLRHRSIDPVCLEHAAVNLVDNRVHGCNKLYYEGGIGNSGVVLLGSRETYGVEVGEYAAPGT